MKSILYHTGLTSPPLVEIEGLEICYYPVLKVKYESNLVPHDISEILYMDPIVLMMSKNAVLGIKKWLEHYNLETDIFDDVSFWTVGDRTHACLKNILGISSFFPDVMTGKGVLQVLQKQNISKVLLVSGQDPRKEFVDGLSSAGINFFHFPVYKIHINENSKFSVHFNDDLSNYLIITSPSSVDGILKILSLQDLSELKTRIISIGPTTSEAILQNKGDVFFESEVQNINVLYDHLESIIIKSSVK